MKKQITILTLFFATIFANAQFINITTDNGLLSNKVNCFKKDDLGNLWIGTDEGISVLSSSGAFTGYTSTNGLISNNITDIEIDNYGKIWVGSPYGLSIYDGTTWTTHTFWSSNANKINDIEVRTNGEIWFATDAGIKVYNGFIYYGYTTADGLPTNEIRNIEEDNNGNVWVATYLGLCRFNNPGFTIYTTADGLSGNSISDILSVGDTLYISGINKLNTYIGSTFTYYDNITDNISILGQLTKANNNDIYFATYFPQNYTTGIRLINNFNIINDISYFNSNLSYCTNNLNLYFSDSTLFIGTEDRGCFYTKNNLFSTHSNDTLNINNINALVNPWGSLFESSNHDSSGLSMGCFEVPAGSQHYANKSASVWIGGMNDDNSFCLAGYHSHQMEETDWSIGPISNNYLSEEYHKKYDRVWKIDKSEIDEHIANWNVPGYTMPEVIENWPDIADYEDVNSNGIYDPENGDYPKIRGDQAILSIFNDDHKTFTQDRNKMKVEIHSLTYAYNSTDSALNNTIFTNYKIINHSNNNYHSVYLGIYDDSDVGGNTDDYFGTDTARNSYYFYNADNTDDYYGTNNIPAQSVSFLNTKIKSTCYFSYPAYGITPPWYMTEPQTALEYYNYLMGFWRDGTPMTYGANAYGGATQTHYVFTGDPSVPTGWNESDAGNDPGDRIGLGVVGPFDLNVGQELCIDVAYINAIAWNYTNLHSVKKLKSRIENIQTWYSNQSFSCDSIITYPQNTLGISAIDTSFCGGPYNPSVELQSIRIGGEYPFSYQWESDDGTYSSTNIAPYISCPLTTTDYYVTITDNLGNIAIDTLTINIIPAPSIELGNDTTICAGESINIVLPTTYSYVWNTGSTSNEIEISTSGNYVVTASNNACTIFDHKYVDVISPEINLTEITPACINEPLQLSIDNYPVINWNTGETTSNININTSALGQTYYYVSVTDTNGCTNYDSTLVVVNDLPNIYLGNDTAIDETWSLILNAYVGPNGNYIWSDGSNNSTYNFDGSIGEGTYNISVDVTDINGCSNSDDINITVVLGLFIDENGNYSIIIYPNPSQTEFNIELPDNKSYKYRITNIKGSIIKTGIFDNTLNKLSIENAEKGTYFLIIDELNINEKLILM